MPTVDPAVTKAAAGKVTPASKVAPAAGVAWQEPAARLQGERRVARGKAQVETLALAEWE